MATLIEQHMELGRELAEAATAMREVADSADWDLVDGRKREYLIARDRFNEFVARTDVRTALRTRIKAQIRRR